MSDERPWAWVVWTGLMSAFDNDEEQAAALLERCIDRKIDFMKPADEALAIILGERVDA
ncbi:hypothetical protein KIKIMORA_01670 [Brevundimonas phage vB_BpoS-Kikimora]|uniref:Uncharacterized protein n=2 Tax=Kikimoravirus TaxID=3425051 RepID=A0A9E7SSQ3_9CAUD|nr:hypothetical protein KIKIMORA_01670 [Brevundimonas phage vB_BpoS-Kikimora]UTC28205.1 hypothetical protein GURKE_01740 [Brevundimonas phage vB_BpoS-Gurke]